MHVRIFPEGKATRKCDYMILDTLSSPDDKVFKIYSISLPASSNLCFAWLANFREGSPTLFTKIFTILCKERKLKKYIYIHEKVGIHLLTDLS